MVHTNATLLPNSTLGSENYASHIGQTFFDQVLIDEVEKLAPYTSNTQPLTTNAKDFIMAADARVEGVDPVMEYTLLGDNLQDGLFAWIAFGVNRTRSQVVEPAVFLYKEGGVANPNGGGGGPPGGEFPPGGGFPSGFPSGGPSGFPSGGPRPTGTQGTGPRPSGTGSAPVASGTASAPGGVVTSGADRSRVVLADGARVVARAVMGAARGLVL